MIRVLKSHKEMHMSVFMNWFRDEMSKISEDDIKAPEREVGKREVVIGTLESIEVKKIHVLRHCVSHELIDLVKVATIKAIQHAVEHSSVEHDPETCEGCAVVRDVSILKEKADLVDNLFWACLKSELPKDALYRLLQDMDAGIGVRKGWKIVLIPQEDPLGIALPGVGFLMV